MQEGTHLCSENWGTSRLQAPQRRCWVESKSLGSSKARKGCPITIAILLLLFLLGRASWLVSGRCLWRLSQWTLRCSAWR